MIGLHTIFRSLPHRYPAVLVDRVIDCDSPDQLYAIKAISCAEPWYQDLDQPDAIDLEYPPALLLESWCQAASLLVLAGRTVAAGSTLLLGRVGGIRFLSPVIPGDVVKHRVRLDLDSGDTFVFSGDSVVAEEPVLQVGSVVLAIRPETVVRSEQ